MDRHQCWSRGRRRQGAGNAGPRTVARATGLGSASALLLMWVGVPSASANPPSGSSGAITIQVTGAPLTAIASTGSSLTPKFTVGDTDYVWYCTSGANAITLTLSSSGTISANGQTGSWTPFEAG